MTKKPRVLVLVLTDLKHDNRVKRQIGFISDQCSITVACAGEAPGVADKTIVLPVKKPGLFSKGLLTGLLLLRVFMPAFRLMYPYRKSLKQQLGNEHFDLIIANDVDTLPLAFDLKQTGTRVIFDAHEYAPRHFEDRLWWRILFAPLNYFLCKKYIPRTDAMMTVSGGLASEYEKHFGKKPVLLTNAAEYVETAPVPTPENQVRMVHHGTVGRSRKTELMIEMMKYLPDRFSLDFVLTSSSSANQQTRQYMDELRALAANDHRIRFLDPVPSNQVVPMLQNYDIGVFLIPPVTFNYSHGLPNKLFDFIQARLAVGVAPTHEMNRITRHYNLGVVSPDFTPESLAAGLSKLTRSDIDVFKQNADKAAHELNSEKNKVIFNGLVTEVLSK